MASDLLVSSTPRLWRDCTCSSSQLYIVRLEKKLYSTNLQGLLRPGQEESSRPARTEKGTNRWWSLKTWYRSRDPFLGVSVLKFSGLVSVSKFSGLETSNIAEKWFIKISVTQRFFVCYNCRLETTKTCRKNARNLKKIQVRSDNDIALKYLAKCTNFEVSSLRLGLEVQVSVSEFLMKSQSRLEILTRSRSRRLQARLHHCYGHTKHLATLWSSTFPALRQINFIIRAWRALWRCVFTAHLHFTVLAI